MWGRIVGRKASIERRICISGTGRAGTTYFVQLFTALGFDTGADRLNYSEKARAGLEFSIFDPMARA